MDLLRGGQPIALHCVAGLGRAPLLVAIALVEYGQTRTSSNIYTRKATGAIKHYSFNIFLPTRNRRNHHPSALYPERDKHAALGTIQSIRVVFIS